MYEKMVKAMKKARVNDREVRMVILQGLIEGHESNIVQRLEEIGLEVEEHDLLFLLDVVFS